MTLGGASSSGTPGSTTTPSARDSAEAGSNGEYNTRLVALGLKEAIFAAAPAGEQPAGRLCEQFG